MTADQPDSQPNDSGFAAPARSGAPARRPTDSARDRSVRASDAGADAGKSSKNGHNFPLTAMVGMERASTALALLTVVPQLGAAVIVGDHGAGKSTLVRSFGALLPFDAPFVEFPPRLVRSAYEPLDQADLRRNADESFKGADGGLLYFDSWQSLELLSPIVASHFDRHYGAASRAPAADSWLGPGDSAQFVVAASAPNLATIPAEFADRFALAVQLPPPSAAQRAEIVRRHLEYNADPEAFRQIWDDSQGEFVRRMELARPGEFPRQLLGPLGAIAEALGVRSVRADLAFAQAASAHAGWQGRSDVTEQDLAAVAPLVFLHRLGHQTPGADSAGMVTGALEHALGGPVSPAVGPAAPRRSLGGATDRAHSQEPGRPEPGVGRQGAGRQGAGEAESSSTAVNPFGRPHKPSERGAAAKRGEPIADPSAPDSTNSMPASADSSAPDSAPAELSTTAAPAHESGQGSLGTDGPRTGVGGPSPGSPRAEDANEARTGAGDTDQVVAAAGENPTLTVPGCFAAVGSERMHASESRSVDPRPVPHDSQNLHPAGSTQGGLRDLIVLVVDTSANPGTDVRVRAAREATLRLISSPETAGHQVALVAYCEGGAHVILRPTNSTNVAQAQLENIPHGGATTLVAGLSAGLSMTSRHSSHDPTNPPLLVYLTNGFATPESTDQARTDRAAVEVAERVGRRYLNTLVIDWSPDATPREAARLLAECMGAVYFTPAALDADGLFATIRSMVAQAPVR